MIILTGGAGFIGTNTVEAMNAMGQHDILIVDNIASTDKWKNLVGKLFSEYVQKEILRDWLNNNKDENIEAVIHLGACSDTMERDFDYLTENNIAYSQRLWRYCTAEGIPFIYASSAATYGNGSKGFSDDHDTTTVYDPINAYGYTKHLFDIWALKQKHTPPFWYGIKFFNVYGPHEWHKGRMASVASFAIPQALNKGQVRLFKSYKEDIPHGEQKRDFIFVDDAVKIILYLLEKHPQNGLYNAGTGYAYSYNDLAKAIFKAVGKITNIEYFDMPEKLKQKYQYYTKAEMSKLLNAGYTEPFIRLEEGINKYTAFIKKINN